MKTCFYVASFCLLARIGLCASTTRIYTLNDESSKVTVIDPASNKVVQTIEGIEKPHGVAFSPDGSRAYITSDSQNYLAVVDTKTGEIIKKIQLSDNANVPSITKDGSRVFACIRGGGGAVDIVDTASLEKVKTLPMKAPMHDCFTTPDGKYVIGGSVEGKFAVVIDVRTEQPAWDLQFDRGVLTMAIEGGRDGGATRRLFVQLVGFRGFAVVDFASHKEVARIKLPDNPKGFVGEQATHGSAISPDGKTLLVNSSAANAMFSYSLYDYPEVKLLGYVPMPVKTRASGGHPPEGGHPQWLAITPDGKTAYDCIAHANMVSVVDIHNLKEVTRIPIEGNPSRCTTFVMP